MLQAIDGLMLAHVALGTGAILAGVVAFAAPKGRPIHILAGRGFVVMMALSSALGAILGLIKADQFYITFHAGILALTLILSAWMAARDRSGRPGGAYLILTGIALINTVALGVVGVKALGATGGMLMGFAAEDYFFLAGLSGLVVITDASLLFRKTVSDRHRIARHLWRMGLGFFIAAGSAFTGPGAKAFPEVVQASGLLILPELITLALIVFWLIFTLVRREKAMKTLS